MFVLSFTFVYSSSISNRPNCVPYCNGKITQTDHTLVAAAAVATVMVVVVVVWVLCNSNSLSHVCNQYYLSMLWIIMSLYKEISDLLALIGSIIFNTEKITHWCVIWVRFVVLFWIFVCFIFSFHNFEGRHIRSLICQLLLKCSHLISESKDSCYLTITK